MGQRKMNFVAISTKALANPIRSFEAGMALWACPVLVRNRAFIRPQGLIFGCGLLPHRAKANPRFKGLYAILSIALKIFVAMGKPLFSLSSAIKTVLTRE